ncbi:DUF1697 domain-containing protein [Candidatus Gracilibacteria bacterium]|nr:DUF1697 domain-containing protein [Candidatus Gracilibacteria bacterium]
MQKYVALLRGINVGGNKKVEMSRLKTCFEEMGHEDVTTYINSGNVIFSSDNSDFSKIEEKLKTTFGFDIPVILRSRENILQLVYQIREEWKNDTEQKTDVLFLTPEYANENSLELIKIIPEIDNLIYLDGAIIWNIDRVNYNRSGMNKFIGTIIYKNMTARNINTVRKLAEKLH